MADKNLQDVVSRLESVATRLESLAVGGGSGASVGADEVAPFVLAYDEILNGPAAEFFAKSDAIGGQVKEQADIVKELFAAQREFLFVASKSNQPDANTLMDILKPSATKLQAVQDYRENHRGGEFFNHLSTISESIGAFGWVTVSPAPSPYVKEMADAGVFYKNRIVKIKEKDPVHTAWGKAWTTTLNDLQAYVKVHHTTGVTWNPRGGDAKAVKPAGGAAPPPPPPPAAIPPPPPPPPADGVAAVSDEGDRSALFASINQGEGVTQGLRKVTDDMKTHKNPALRQGPAPFKPKVQPKPVPTPAAKPTVSPAKPPVFELQQGKKWIVEHQKNNQNLVISETEMRQTVYIFKCENSVINIKGKVNSIIIDSCKKTGLVCQDVLATVEFVNCQSVKGQVLGSVPTVSIDKTDGCMVYLSENSLGVDILTAKSSEMNILVPEGTEGDFKEFALPEQYKTNYNRSTGTISTVQTEI